jgi:hypothetical protein
LGWRPSSRPRFTELRHVRSAAEKRAAEEIANRQKCEDFEGFKPLFEQVQKELSAGLRQTRRFERKSEIAPGRFYILGGQKAYVAATEEPFTNEHGNIDARLRVIFDNGTESNLLMRSLAKGAATGPRRPTDHRALGRSAFSPIIMKKGTRPSASSMCCGASPIIRPSQRIAMCCTRSA